MRTGLTRPSAVVAFLLPPVLASCAASDRLKELALPDQLHLYYEDYDGEYENKQVAGRGFYGDGNALGIGLSWSLSLPPAPALTREDLRALVRELRPPERALVAEASVPIEAVPEDLAAQALPVVEPVTETLAEEAPHPESVPEPAALIEAMPAAPEPPPQEVVPESSPEVAIEVAPQPEPPAPAVEAPAVTVAESLGASPLPERPSHSKRLVIIAVAATLALLMLCARILGKTAQKA